MPPVLSFKLLQSHATQWGELWKLATLVTLMSNTFSWKTKFKSIIIVDGELFGNEYNLNISLTPHTANLKEQTEYFDRLKNLFELVFANTITTWRDEKLYHVLKKSSNNRFVELPKPPYDRERKS